MPIENPSPQLKFRPPPPPIPMGVKLTPMLKLLAQRKPTLLVVANYIDEWRVLWSIQNYMVLEMILLL